MDSLPTKITIGDKYHPAMKITEQAEADAYFELWKERLACTPEHTNREGASQPLRADKRRS